MSPSTILIYCRTIRYTRQVTPYSTVRFIARIMAEIIYNFLCLNGLTKVGMVKKDNAADNVPVHHVQEVVDVIESQLKPRLIFY